MANKLGQYVKGEHPSLATEFQKGHKTWNKGIVYEQILGEKHPQWKGGKPDCMDCGVKLRKYTSKRCSPCHLKSDDFTSAIRAAQAANTGIVGHRKGVKMTEEQKLRISKSKQGQPAWNRGMKFPEFSGENNPNWRGGTGTERHQQMSSIEYKTWRQLVFQRDNYTCQICDQYGGVLHADHIKTWKEHEELRYAVDNGRTLCVPCHYYITFKRKMPIGAKWCNYLMTRKAG